MAMINEDIYLGICEPSVASVVHNSYHRSFTIMRKPVKWDFIVPFLPIGDFAYNIGRARDSLVLQAMERGCTHILMLDTDQVYRTPDMIERMLAHNLPVVTARCYKRYPPFDHILYRVAEDENGERNFTPYNGDFPIVPVPDSAVESGDLVEVDMTGICACGLFKMEIFYELPQPWFQFIEATDDNPKPIGEDVHFCLRMRQKGYQIFCDTSIEVGHLSMIEVDHSLYKVWKHLHGIK